MKCNCGCGRETTIYKGKPRKYISGHHKGMLGKHHTKASNEKNKQSHLGRIPWNKGLTKETDERVKKYSEKSQISNKGRLPWNSGKSNIYSEETLNLWSKQRKGKKRTKEQNDKLSKSISNENHWNWKGGISFEPYCKLFNKRLKEQIRERDNYQCQYPECLTTQLESKIIYNEKLIPHHIHYDKENCYPDLILLCRKHNTKVNYNREYYEKLFMEILEKRELLNYFGDIK